MGAGVGEQSDKQADSAGDFLNKQFKARTGASFLDGSLETAGPSRGADGIGSLPLCV